MKAVIFSAVGSAVAVALTGCISLPDFNSAASKIIGANIDETWLKAPIASRREGNVLVNEYRPYGVGPCHILVFIDSESRIIRGWGFPSKLAAETCNSYSRVAH